VIDPVALNMGAGVNRHQDRPTIGTLPDRHGTADQVVHEATRLDEVGGRQQAMRLAQSM